MNKKIYIERLFPDVIEKNLFHKLKIDHESLTYVTVPTDAAQITNIIKQHLIKKNLNIKDCIITDATAGAGGDTISFANHFKSVNAIEINTNRFNYLMNNVEVYKLNNVNLHNDDMMIITPNITQDVIFIDPPWGGKSYKDNENLRLTINDLELESCCIELLKTKPKLIVLKLPSNYDIDFLDEKLKLCGNIVNYKLNKMIITVIDVKE
jgi:16S rRNA G966 N2-methylase RsmD